MDPHSSEHEALIEQLLVGDLTPDDPRARALLDGCVECRAKLAELERLSGRLSAVGEEERSVLAEVAQGKLSAAEEQRLRASVLAQIPRRPRGRMFPWVLGVLAAAAVVAVVFVWRARSDDGARSGGEQYLGGHKVEGVEPDGIVKKFGTFRWRSTALPAGGSYTLRIWSEADPRVPLIVKEELLEPEWTPSSADLEKLPRKLRWQVEMYDAANKERAHSESLPASLP